MDPKSAGIYLALIATLQVLLLAMWQTWSVAKAERRAAEIRSEEKAEAYAREDLVAARAALTAQHVAESSAALERGQRDMMQHSANNVRVTQAANEQIVARLDTLDEQTKEIGGHAKKIHLLVNSEMTAAKTNERDQARLTLFALQRVKELSESLGVEATEAERQAIAVTEARIAELNTVIAERQAAQAAVDVTPT